MWGGGWGWGGAVVGQHMESNVKFMAQSDVAQYEECDEYVW